MGVGLLLSRALVTDPVGERFFNIALGASVLSWAVLGWLHADGAERLAPVRLAAIVLNAQVGTLILIRQRQRQGADLTTLSMAIPSFVAGGVAFRLAPEPVNWPVAAQACFVTGAVVVALSFAFLGRSFAILPGLRTVVVRGPYRLVRHPAYLGELAMVAACGIAAWSWWAVLLPLAAVPLAVVRILAEEKVLGTSDDYRSYRKRVRWRLVSHVW